MGRASVIGVLAATTVAGFVAPAMAAPVAPASTSLATMSLAASVTPNAKPNTTIEGKPVNWHPNKLTVAPVSKCNSTTYSFTITNKSGKAQVIQEKTSSGKKTIGTIGKGKKGAICSSGPKGAKGTLYLKADGKAFTETLS